jgi:hypothetical protein
MGEKSDGSKKMRRVKEDEVRKILMEHELWNSTLGSKGRKGNLSLLDMSGLVLDNSVFYGIEIKNSSFKGARLRNCLFEKVFIENTDFSDCFMHKAKFKKSYVQVSNFMGAKLEQSSFLSCHIWTSDFRNADLYDSTIDISRGEPILSNEQRLSVVLIKSDETFDIQNIENQANFEIGKLKKELEEQKRQLAAAQKGEEDKIKAATKLIEEKLEEKENELERERAAKKSTKEDIEKGITHLQAPNKYLKAQIIIQYSLASIYALLSVITVVFLLYYIHNNYAEFKALVTPETTFLQWLFYTIPIAVSFSLVLTFINQINSRLKNVVSLHEKKRYVDSISGGLKAVQELSENNKEARARISNVLDEILNNTITLSEKLQEDILLEDKPVENKISVSLQELKDMFSK